jgi:uncharacterized protein YkwD
MNSVFKNVLILIVFGMVLFSCSEESDDNHLYNTAETLSIENATYTQIEVEILKLVNDHRSELGISSLIKVDIISSVADSHTNYMIENEKLSHYNFDKRQQYLMSNANAKSVGENVAYGYKSAEGVFNSWLKSDGHRKIIENKNFTHFGISTGLNSEGRCYFTQIFIRIE